MRLISYRLDGQDRYGVVTDAGVVDMSVRLGARAPTLRDAIAAGCLDEMKSLAAGATAAAVDCALESVEFALPIPQPQKILCAGRNYRAYHEVAQDGNLPKFPSIFGRLPNSFAAHGQAILKPKKGDQLDYEGELVAVIGARGRHVPQESALDHVVGYTCMNEGTVRDWMKKGTQNTPAKNFYRSGSIGPWIATADEVGDPSRLHITTRRNGEVVQDGGTDMMIFDLPYLIAHISKFTWLEPGDMIATGSPGGSIIESDSPDWLKPGDALEVEISGIGALANPIEAE